MNNKMSQKESNKKNPEYWRNYCAGHREKIREYNRKYRETHREEIRQRARKYYEEHNTSINEKNKRRYAENIEEYREKNNQYKVDNRESYREYERQFRLKLKDPESPEPGSRGGKYVLLTCQHCGRMFRERQSRLDYLIKNNKPPVKFCSKKCYNEYRRERKKSTESD
ncbi:MAG TPA: hypothetical protein O0X39_00995 [Methanocorpusculum sp.]|nr:hypothetical protein [Methanocorpusculum sp.]